MFNVVINNEQYDEYLAQKEKIKELEARNDFLKEQYDQLNEKFQANSDHEELVCMNDAQKNKIKDLETLVDSYRQKAIAASGMYHELKAQHESLKEQHEAIIDERNDLLIKLDTIYKNYQSALSDKAALINERDRLTNVVYKQGSDIVGLRAKIYDLNEQNKMIETLHAKIADYDNKDISFKEIVTENYRLRMSNNDLKENNKALKKENEKLINRLHEYESQIAEMAEKATNPDYIKFLETAKKFQECNVTVIENQYNEYRRDCLFCNNDNIKNPVEYMEGKKDD